VRVVLDANVVYAGSGWRGEAYACIVAMARRRIIACATNETLEELRALVAEHGHKAPHSPHSILSWYCERVRLVEPSPLGKRRTRDPEDDPYLACALAANAKIIVSRDQDLLSLDKPFGIEIMTPRDLLRKLARQYN
jgi:putative PIN family toxin of toxin-antitoxin system